MPSVSDIFRDLHQADPDLVRELVPGADRPIWDIHLVDDLRDAEQAEPGGLILLTRRASLKAEGYELDVAVRRLREPAGLVIQSSCRYPSMTAVRIADRLQLPILWLQKERDLGFLFRRLVRFIHDETGALLERVEDLLDVIDDVDRRGGDVLKVVAESDFLGFEIGEADARLVGAPLDLTDTDADWLQRLPGDRFEALLSRLIAWRLAASFTRRRMEEERVDRLSIHSAGEFLDQILVDVDEQQLGQHLRRARTFGLPIDAWHEVIRIELANLLTLSDNDPVLTYERNHELARMALQAARRAGGTWNMVTRPSGCLLIRTRSFPRGPQDARGLEQQMARILALLEQRLAGIVIYCGIGSSHEGASGLKAASSEAESAVQSARLRGTSNQPVMFDAPGIRRLLLEWYSSTAVRESIDELLAPLDELANPDKKDEYIETLRVYLDTNRSIARSAERLSVHRNTVTYRVKRILDLLAVDLDDPHQALSLHLACHADLGNSSGGH